ncbi:MAG: tripartite tricarboxylate transporter substrate binding protein [Burkholderiales bacterium]|nr:tripartite tricarboxylate transporter substrate binding protein [Burkholderiales bacterium]
MKVSTLAAGVALATAALFAAAPASAQGAFPSKPVTIVAAFPPGGTVDLLARVLGPKLADEWKQPVVVENKAGASGVVGSQFVQRAAPDGHVLMVIPITHVTNSSLMKSVPFDPIRDFTAVTLLASQPIMLVANKSQPFKSVQELIVYAKANPGKLNCGSGGNGTSQHLACELFKSQARVDIKHIPYKGNAAAMTDVIGGQIELLFDQMATAVPHVKGDRVRALAVTTSTRSAAMPEVPTVAESGVPGFETNAWFGVVGPAGMPKDVADRIQASYARALAQPDIKEKLAAQGLTLVGNKPEEFGAYMQAEMGKWAKVIQEAGIKIE